MAKKKYMTIQFHDGEMLTVQADELHQLDDGFWNFAKKVSDSEKSEFVATVQCSNIKYITIENRGE